MLTFNFVEEVIKLQFEVHRK